MDLIYHRGGLWKLKRHQAGKPKVHIKRKKVACLAIKGCLADNLERCTCHSRSCIICSCLLLIDCVDAYQLLKDLPLTLILLGSAEVHSVLILMFWNHLGLTLASLSLHIWLLFCGRRNKKFGQVGFKAAYRVCRVTQSPERRPQSPSTLRSSFTSLRFNLVIFEEGDRQNKPHSTFHLKSSFIYAIRQCCTPFLLILIMQDRFIFCCCLPCKIYGLLGTCWQHEICSLYYFFPQG